MTNSKKIVITTESREIVIVRRIAERGFQSYCGTCAAETEMLTLDQGVSCALTNTREMIRRIDEGRVHSLETPSGHLLICRNSLELIGDGL